MGWERKSGMHNEEGQEEEVEEEENEEEERCKKLYEEKQKGKGRA